MSLVGRIPLRLRLTAAFAVTTTLALLALGAFVYYRVEATLVAQARTGLDAQLEALAEVPPARRALAVQDVGPPLLAQLLTGRGAVLSSSPGVAAPLLPVDALPSEGTVSVERRVRLVRQAEGEDALIVARREGPEVLVVATSREDLADALQEVLIQLLVAAVLLLLAASALGYLVTGSALRPLERMRRQAASISAQRSAERLPLAAPDDEVRRLGETLNAMLDRLDAGLRRERRFVAEAGHELRTPLALLRMELDLALSSPRTAEELRDALRSAGEEVDRLTRLSEALLAATTPPAAVAAPPVDVVALLEDVVLRFSAAYRGAGRTVTVAAEGPLPVAADAAQLDQVLTNLLDNALRHGSGELRLVARSTAGVVSLEVQDDGPGPLPELGSGLGLTIVRAIVERHAGQVSVETREEPPRTVVRIELPQPPLRCAP